MCVAVPFDIIRQLMRASCDDDDASAAVLSQVFADVIRPSRLAVCEGRGDILHGVFLDFFEQDWPDSGILFRFE